MDPRGNILSKKLVKHLLIRDVQADLQLCCSCMSLVVRKPVFGIFDLVPHKPGCTAIEDG